MMQWSLVLRHTALLELRAHVVAQDRIGGYLEPVNYVGISIYSSIDPGSSMQRTWKDLDRGKGHSTSFLLHTWQTILVTSIRARGQ